MAGSYTIKMSTSEAPLVHAFFTGHEFEFREQPHALWQARGPGCNATFYTSGKLLLQGKEADVWRGLLGDISADAQPYHQALQRHPKPPPALWAGTDEAGKGDYFGALVVAGVGLRRADLEILYTLGVDDSKAVPDGRIPEIEQGIRGVCMTEVLMIGPEKYNALYAKIGNLNRLLAWAHGKVIENLLARATDPAIEWVLIDRFASDHVIERSLGPLGRAARIDQWPKAESDPAVAAASVLARGAYLRSLKSLSKRFGVELRGGAGGPTLASGRQFVATHGAAALQQVGKLHFATTQQIGG
jgi:ribonuclease HIII